MSNSKPLILIVEDEAGIREAISIYLQETGIDSVTACNGKEGLEAFRKTPDISCIIADIMMPELDGFSMVEEIRKVSDIPVLFLSAKAQDFDKVRAFNLGADDYLTKPFSSMELIARVKSLVRRYKTVLDLRNNTSRQDEEILYIKGLEMNLTTRDVFVHGEPVHLTPKEFAILELFLRHPGRVFTPNEIYEIVWQDVPMGTETVNVHVRKLREKIELDPKNPQFIIMVWGIGYRVRKD
ncbi:MAG: response regulator transcription factor [Erysipelotrichaceae bacterium]|nr:response regulator transcription factor [Erysipelotrichaceae bacterium]